MRVRQPSAVLVILAMTATGFAAGQTPSAAQGTTGAAADPVATAKAEAKRQNRRVEIEALRTEQSTTWANSDGRTLHAELATVPVRAKTNRGWRTVDTTLAKEGNVVRPKVATAGIDLSAGGTTTLATLTNERGRSVIGWPQPLPAPVLDRDTATYPDAVAKGVDLVVRATAAGIDRSIVIRSRPAGEQTYRIPVMPSQNPGSKLTMADAEAAAGEAGLDHRGVATIAVEAKGQVLAITPDQAFLAGSAVKYPVTFAVPDVWVGAGQADDTFISNVTYPNSQRSATWLRTGKSSSGAETWRTYLKFDIASTHINNSTILNADLRLWNYRSNTCGEAVGSGIVARRVTSFWSSNTLTWSTQPSTTTTHQSANPAAYSDLCSWGEGELFHSIEGIVQDWADGIADQGLQLRAVNESDATNWRQYRSSEYTGASGRGPVLFIDYEPQMTQTTLMTWNIAGGAIDAGADKWAAHITAGGAQIVGLQEVCYFQADDIESQLEIQSTVAWERYFGAAQDFTLGCQGAAFGQLFLVQSRLSPRDWANFPYPHEETGCDGDPEERAFQAVTVTIDGVDVRVFNTHMATAGNASCQVPVIIAQAMQWPNAIVMGDFNLRPTDSPMQQWTANGFRNLHPDNYLTVSNYPEDCNRPATLKFDYIWVRGNVLKDWDIAPICNNASDHRALLAGVLTP